MPLYRRSDFKTSLSNNDTVTLRQCLRTYALIDKASDVELMFRDLAVAPFMEATVTKDAVRPSGEGLAAMYDAILGFVTTTCVPVMEVSAVECTVVAIRPGGNGV